MGVGGTSWLTHGCPELAPGCSRLWPGGVFVDPVNKGMHAGKKVGVTFRPLAWAEEDGPAGRAVSGWGLLASHSPALATWAWWRGGQNREPPSETGAGCLMGPFWGTSGMRTPAWRGERKTGRMSVPSGLAPVGADGPRHWPSPGSHSPAGALGSHHRGGTFVPNTEGWVSSLQQLPPHTPTETQVLALDGHACDMQT